MKKLQILGCALLLLAGCTLKEEAKLTKKEIINLEETYTESSVVINIQDFHTTNDNNVMMSALVVSGTLQEDSSLSFINSYGQIQNVEFLIDKYGSDEHIAETNELITLSLRNVTIEEIENSSILFVE